MHDVPFWGCSTALYFEHHPQRQIFFLSIEFQDEWKTQKKRLTSSSSFAPRALKRTLCLSVWRRFGKTQTSLVLHSLFHRLLLGESQAEAKVVAAATRRSVATNSNTADPRIDVPAAATNHAVRPTGRTCRI